MSKKSKAKLQKLQTPQHGTMTYLDVMSKILSDASGRPESQFRQMEEMWSEPTDVLAWLVKVW